MYKVNGALYPSKAIYDLDCKIARDMERKEKYKLKRRKKRKAERSNKRGKAN